MFNRSICIIGGLPCAPCDGSSWRRSFSLWDSQWSAQAPSPGAAPASPKAQADGVGWTSGWVDILPGQTLTLTHGLGGDPALYATGLWFRDMRAEGLSIHHRAYGGMAIGDMRVGAYWHNLTHETISVTREPNDPFVSQVRLKLWRADPYAYDSGWMNINAGTVITLTHGLGGNTDDYVVGVKFRDVFGPMGIHQYTLGGMEIGGRMLGGAWQALTNNTIQIGRFADDDLTVRQIRIFISLPDPPDFDSGWVALPPGAVPVVPHNLGDPPDSYQVLVAQRSTAFGANTRAYGGLEASGRFYGMNWQNLSSTAIALLRQPNDVSAEQARVRIWRLITPTLCVPTLLSPTEGAMMDNGRTDATDAKVWDFRWSECEGATRYHLYVIGPAATIPVVDDQNLTGASYRLVDHGYVSASHLEGWTWRVRAEVDGAWGEWSGARLFGVEPVNSDPPPMCLPLLMMAG